MRMMRSHIALIKGDVAVVLLIDIEKLNQAFEHEVVKRSYPFCDFANMLSNAGSERNFYAFHGVSQRN